jgi:PHD/YefM family antitoxin component YafN of YafNO toxin-antitoxin module
MTHFHPQYIIDQNGHKTSVILSIEEFESLLEDLEDLAIIAERRDEPSITHNDLVAELKKDGLI